MPNYRGRNQGSFSRAPRRQTQWGGTTSGQTSETALAAATSVLFSRFTAATLEVFPGTPLTVVRNRGLFSVRSDQIVQTEMGHGAFGMAVVSEDAAAAGIASVPTPITNSDWDGWMVWQPFAFGLVFSSAVGFDNNPYQRYDYDSKAMRKLNDNESLIFVVENQDAGSGALFNWVSRSLFKLH